jgi:membrane-associated protease RseP (regulator of RpoE activity)
MDPSTLGPPDSGRPTPGYAAWNRDYVPPPPEPEERRHPIVRHIVLFILTFLLTTFVGVDHYYGFQSDFATAPPPQLEWTDYFNGLWYSMAILGILGAHEFGHYLACRYYQVDASLPYFIPAPLLTGTLGAFIRIRQPIPDKRQLFDIGIAGPIAGFLVAVPVLVLGISLSRVVLIPAEATGGLELGEPLLLQLIAGVLWGSIPDGSTLNMHPTAFAGWFGCLATALNLFPIGQLDGGHISYAVLGRRSTVVTYGTILCLAGLSFVSSSWIVWTVLNVVMLFLFGPRHPRTPDEDIPLDTTRKWLAVFAVVMFAVCFTPSPIEPLELVSAGR